MADEPESILELHYVCILRKLMDLLPYTVWTKGKSSVFQHDSFSCGRYGADHPFPTSRSGFEHVGSVYIDKKMRQVDVDILRNASLVLPRVYLPTYHHSWHN
jgi:hypothetical protein